jgi:hypothetical protein
MPSISDPTPTAQPVFSRKPSKRPRLMVETGLLSPLIDALLENAEAPPRGAPQRVTIHAQGEWSFF